MSTCKDCLKPFSSRQSLCNHRKRAHPVSKGDSYLVPPKLKAQEKGRMTEGQKVTDMISGRDDVEDTSPENVDVSTGDESDDEASDNEVLGLHEEDIEWPKDIKKQNSMLIDAFTKLYRHDFEGDVEMRKTIAHTYVPTYILWDTFLFNVMKRLDINLLIRRKNHLHKGKNTIIL